MKNKSVRQILWQFFILAFIFGSIALLSPTNYAYAQHIDQEVGVLHFAISTGDDDVRQDSQVIAVLTILQGGQINDVSESLNHGANWKNNTTALVDMNIPLVKVRDIQAFRIDFQSGQPGPFDTEDNWNMDTIRASYDLSSGGTETLFEQEGGHPLHRFTGSNPTWGLHFNWE